MGFGPQLADLDGDGNLDLLSGSWPGEVFFFKGGPGRTFAAPVKLKHKSGKSINVGGGVRENGTDAILVAGDATFEETEKGRVIVYEGERIEIPEGKGGGITGTASAVHAVDWDGDGDMDLLVGEIEGGVHLVPNEGTRTEPAFGKDAPLRFGLFLPVKVSHDAGPFAADWDGDGDLDLLVGSGDGSVALYRNAGGMPPKLGAPEQLVPPGQVTYGEGAPATPVRGGRSKVCAADWNGDGRLDLLVGDIATQRPQRPEPTPEEKAAQRALRKELEAVSQTWWALAQDVESRKGEEHDKASKELAALDARMQELRLKVVPEYEDHGWVWLFLRKGA